MTSRECPWCGGKNLHIKNVMGTTQTIYWEDRDCGYREQTGYGEDYPFKSCIKPRQKKPDFVERVAIPEQQQTLEDGV